MFIIDGKVQNLREEMTMDVDEDENATQRPKAAVDFGIQVDFSSMDDEDPEEPAAAFARLDKEISDKIAEIERMAPNMRAMERYAAFRYDGGMLIFSSH